LAGAALKTERVYLLHGAEGVKSNPLRIAGIFRQSTLLSLWLILAYLVGGIGGIIMTGITGALFREVPLTLAILSVTFYALTTIESFCIPTLLYNRAIDKPIERHKIRAQKRLERVKEDSLVPANNSFAARWHVESIV